MRKSACGEYLQGVDEGFDDTCCKDDVDIIGEIVWVNIVGDCVGEYRGMIVWEIVGGSCGNLCVSSLYDRPIKVVYSTSSTPSRRYSSPIQTTPRNDHKRHEQTRIWLGER